MLRTCRTPRCLLPLLFFCLLLAGCRSADPAPTPTPPAGLPGVGTLDDILAQQEPLPEASSGGFGIAWVTLAALVVGLVAGGGVLLRQRPFSNLWRGQNLAALPVVHWLLPLLALAGLGVSIYLAYVETSETVSAICGPVGNCNAVQDSPYAIFLGVPVALWGMVNYVGLIGLWIGQRWGHGRIQGLAALGLVALTFGGVLFSIYLTVLELFVIEAVCMWCISSAVITLALFGLSLVLAVAAARNGR